MAVYITQILIHRPPEIVWDYLVIPENWLDWWGTALESVVPGWRVGAKVIWEMGSSSRVGVFRPPEELRIEDSLTTLTWRLGKLGDDTLLEVEETMDSRLSQPMIHVWKTGMDAVLRRLKAIVEGEPLQENAPLPNQPDHREKKQVNRLLIPGALLLLLVAIIGIQAVSYLYLSRMGVIPAVYPLEWVGPSEPVIPPGQVAIIPVTGGETVVGGQSDGQIGGWEVRGGSARIEQGVFYLAATKTGFPALAYPTGACQTPQPYSLEASLRLTQPEIAGSGRYGLLFGLDEAGRYYRFDVEPDQAYISLTRWDGAMWQTLVHPKRIEGLNLAPQANNLKVEVRAQQIILYVNDEMAESYTGPMTGVAGCFGVIVEEPGAELAVERLLMTQETP